MLKRSGGPASAGGRGLILVALIGFLSGLLGVFVGFTAHGSRFTVHGLEFGKAFAEQAQGTGREGERERGGQGERETEVRAEGLDVRGQGVVVKDEELITVKVTVAEQRIVHLEQEIATLKEQMRQLMGTLETRRQGDGEMERWGDRETEVGSQRVVAVDEWLRTGDEKLKTDREKSSGHIILMPGTGGGVGIGTTGPGAKLSVAGGGAFGSTYAGTSVADGNVIISGNVGIGTTGPSSKLNIVGDIIADFGSDTKRIVGISGFAGGKTGIFRFADQWNQLEVTHEGDMIMKGFHGIQLVGQSFGGQSNKAYILQVLDGAFPKLTVLKSTGNVGIGTVAPAQRLHVIGNAAISGNVGIGTTSPQGALDVVSTTGAFIVPRMTTTQRDALTAVNGMIIYNTTDNQFNFYENGIWVLK